MKKSEIFACISLLCALFSACAFDDEKLSSATASKDLLTDDISFEARLDIDPTTVRVYFTDSTIGHSSNMYYALFRGTTDDRDAAQWIKTGTFNSRSEAPYYLLDDTLVSRGTYYYWVRKARGTGSDNATRDWLNEQGISITLGEDFKKADAPGTEVAVTTFSRDQDQSQGTETTAATYYTYKNQVQIRLTNPQVKYYYAYLRKNDNSNSDRFIQCLTVNDSALEQRDDDDSQSGSTESDDRVYLYNINLVNQYPYFYNESNHTFPNVDSNDKMKLVFRAAYRSWGGSGTPPIGTSDAGSTTYDFKWEAPSKPSIKIQNETAQEQEFTDENGKPKREASYDMKVLFLDEYNKIISGSEDDITIIPEVPYYYVYYTFQGGDVIGAGTQQWLGCYSPQVEELEPEDGTQDSQDTENENTQVRYYLGINFPSSAYFGKYNLVFYAASQSANNPSTSSLPRGTSEATDAIEFDFQARH